MDFKERLKAIRKERSLTQRELADKIKSNNNTVSNWEKGVSRPTTPVVESLARALGISPFDLLGDFTLGDIQALFNKEADERTPEEETALSFAGSLLFQMDIRPKDALSPEQAAMNIKDVESELQGFCWEVLLENGGREILVAYDTLNNAGKATLIEFLNGLLRVPSYLEEGEEGLDASQVAELDDIKHALRGGA